MAKKITFSVDENSNPEVARTVIRDLRRMIRLGTLAQKAIKGLLRDGFYDGLTPVVDKVTPLHWDQGGYSVQGHYHGKKHATVRFVRLPRLSDISRADLGDMNFLHLSLGPNEDHFNKNNMELKLSITGPIAFQLESGKETYEIRETTFEMGRVRINKNHLSWVDPFGDKGAWRVYKDMKYDGAQDSLRAFSRSVSKRLVRSEAENDGSMAASAKTLNLQNSAWEWFMADGHAERMFREIHDVAKVHEVMNR